jgi:hypothetical protein
MPIEFHFPDVAACKASPEAELIRRKAKLERVCFLSGCRRVYVDAIKTIWTMKKG